MTTQTERRITDRRGDLRRTTDQLERDRQTVLAYVKAHPNLNVVEIKFGLIRLNVNAVRLALVQLRDDGLVECVGNGRARAWVSV